VAGVNFFVIDLVDARPARGLRSASRGDERDPFPPCRPHCHPGLTIGAADTSASSNEPQHAALRQVEPRNPNAARQGKEPILHPTAGASRVRVARTADRISDLARDLLMTNAFQYCPQKERDNEPQTSHWFARGCHRCDTFCHSSTARTCSAQCQRGGGKAFGCGPRPSSSEGSDGAKRGAARRMGYRGPHGPGHDLVRWLDARGNHRYVRVKAPGPASA
jgi:hypothetical protein